MDGGKELGLCTDCGCREGFSWALAIFLTLVLLPLLVAWTLLGLLLSRSPTVAAAVGWIVFSVFAVVSIALDPFEWGYVFGIGLDLFIVTIIVLGYDWPMTWRLTRAIILYLLVIGGLILVVLALTQYSQDGAISGGLSSMLLAGGRRGLQLIGGNTDGGADLDIVLSEADLMDAMNDGAMISGLLAIAWIVCCDQSLWLPATEEKLLEAETRVLRTMCSKRVVQLVVEGLGTLIVTDEDLPNFEPNAEGGALPVVKEEQRRREKNKDNNNREVNKTKKPVMVLVHGYASANCYWAPVLGLLQEHFQVYCVELIGWGRSDRVPWTAKTADEVLDMYRASIERWRMAMGLEKFILVGHSLGCHACAAYTIHYPHRVSHLIFASPAGVGLPPESMRRKMDQNALLDYEFEAPSDTGASTLSNSSFRRNFQFSQFTYSFLSCVWESNLTPMDGVRWLGPFGHVAVSGTLERRALKSGGNSFLRKLRKEQSDALIDFTYQNQAGPPSGERALAPIFLPGAYAKKPLCLWLRGKGYRPRGGGGYTHSDVEGGGGGGLDTPLRRSLSGDERDKDRERDRDRDRDREHDAEERRGLLSTPPRDRDNRLGVPHAASSSTSTTGSGSSSGSGNGNSNGNGNGTASGSAAKPQRDRPPVRTIDCPVTLIYGTPVIDWMNSKYGKDLCDQLNREGVDARLYQMSESGHILYMEQPEEFVFLVTQALFNREGYQQLYRPG